MSEKSCKSAQPPPPPEPPKERRRIWDPERELPRHLGYRLVPCKYCNRTFFANRIDMHQDLCRAKLLQPKRPIYDSVKFRTTGTVTENFKPPTGEEAPGRLNPHWRENREFFKSGVKFLKDERVASLGASKELEAKRHQMAKLAHYVQCPICGRRFGEQAAIQHISHCTNYVSKKRNTSVTTSGFAASGSNGKSSQSKR